MRLKSLSLLVSTLTLIVTFTTSPSAYAAAQQSGGGGAVYVMSNRAEGNSVLVFSRGANGGLQFQREVPTQGLGTGATRDPLMSRGAVRLSSDGHLLFVVNPASGELTAF